MSVDKSKPRKKAKPEDRGGFSRIFGDIVSKKLWRDAKSLIQEMAQEHVGVTPAYHVIQESGPDHDKRFVIGIYFGTDLIAEGKGKSKQEAEQEEVNVQDHSPGCSAWRMLLRSPEELSTVALNHLR